MPDSPPWQVSENCLAALARLARQLADAGMEISHVVTSVATVLETYVDQALAQLVEMSPVGESRLGRALLRAYEEEFYRTWDDRYTWMHIGFGIAVAGTQEGQDVRTLLELRNAIVHGGGRLTARQSRDLKSLLQLEQRLARLLHVQVESGRLAFTGPTAEAAVAIARRFVLWLDNELRQVSSESRLTSGC